MSNTKKIFLNISEIAAYIGQNKYNVVTPFERLWKRVDTNSFNNCINNLETMKCINVSKLNKIEHDKENLVEKLNEKKITKRVFDKQILDLNTVENKVMEEVSKITTKIDKVKLNDSQMVKKVLGDSIQNTIDKNEPLDVIKKNVLKVIEEKKLSKEATLDIIKQSDSVINTNHGIKKEDGAIQMYENEYSVKLDTSQEYTSKHVFNKNDYQIYIGGKVDGLNQENKEIIEVKNRVHNFFSSVRDYENTQIQLYMYIHKYNNAKLVEKYDNQIRVTEIGFNEDYVNKIKENLKIFINAFCSFIDSTPDNSKMDYFNDKEKYLKKLYLSKMKM